MGLCRLAPPEEDELSALQAQVGASPSLKRTILVASSNGCNRRWIEQVCSAIKRSAPKLLLMVLDRMMLTPGSGCLNLGLTPTYLNTLLQRNFWVESLPSLDRRDALFEEVHSPA